MLSERCMSCGCQRVVFIIVIVVIVIVIVIVIVVTWTKTSCVHTSRVIVYNCTGVQYNVQYKKRHRSLIWFKGRNEWKYYGEKDVAVHDRYMCTTRTVQYWHTTSDVFTTILCQANHILSGKRKEKWEGRENSDGNVRTWLHTVSATHPILCTSHRSPYISIDSSVSDIPTLTVL